MSPVMGMVDGQCQECGIVLNHTLSNKSICAVSCTLLHWQLAIMYIHIHCFSILCMLGTDSSWALQETGQEAKFCISNSLTLMQALYDYFCNVTCMN